MKNYFAILLPFLFLSIYSQEISSEDWKTDINFLKSELEKKHKNLYYKISKNEFENDLNKIIQTLDTDSDEITSIKLDQAIVKLGDSHTKIEYTHQLNEQKEFRLKANYFGDDLFITKADEKTPELLDKKIISINNFSINEIREKFKSLFVDENDAIVKIEFQRLFNKKVFLAYFGFVNIKDSIVNIELEDRLGVKSQQKISFKNRFILKLPNAKFEGELPFYLKNENKHFAEKYFKEDKIYYIQYNKCISRESVLKYGDKDKAILQPSFEDFENKVIRELENNEIDKLIFDMRFNQGGSSYLAESLIDKIAKNKKLNTKGKLFVIVGNLTFSSAIFNTLYFKKNTNAIFVGDITAGKPNHYGDVKSFKLPYSVITTTFSTEYFKLNSENETTFTPDYKVVVNYNDFKNGVDSIYEWIKKYK